MKKRIEIEMDTDMIVIGHLYVDEKIEREASMKIGHASEFQGASAIIIDYLTDE